MAAGTGPRRRRAGLPTHKSSLSWGRHRVLLAVLVVIGFGVSGVAGAVAYFLPAIHTAISDTGHNTSAPLHQVTAPASGAPFTVLLLGSDNDTKFPVNGVLTQTMILVRVDPQTRRVVMISIPRDLWVPLSYGGTAKIDAAYANGGAQSAIATVQNDFHVSINYWVWIGLGGLVSLVNHLPGNGVDIVAQMPILDDYYPYDLTGSNPYAYSRIVVLPGPQRVQGVLALEYVRSRHGDILEDIARSQKQQQLLVDIKSAARQLNVTDIPNIASALGSDLATNMSLTQVSSILPLARALTSGHVTQIVMLPPDYTSSVVDSQDVLLPDWSVINGLVSQYFPTT